MADPDILFWAAIPDGSVLEATARNRANKGTFAVTGYLLDHTGDFVKVKNVPFQATLRADHTYQLTLEILPVGGADVDAQVIVEQGGQEIRKSQWNPVKGGPGLRTVIARTEKSQ